MGFLLRVLVNTLAIVLAGHLVPGIRVDSWLAALRDVVLYAWYFVTGLVLRAGRAVARMMKLSVPSSQSWG